jgi:hypothetical protein
MHGATIKKHRYLFSSVVVKMFQAVVCIECRAVCDLSSEDGPDGPKHVGANTRYFNILYV